MSSHGPLSFARDGATWPNHAASRFVKAAGIDWHVQVSGAGPVLLLLHGTGASTHSWRHVEPHLRKRFTVVALDLPGHGFTEAPPRDHLSLAGMAEAVTILLHEMAIEPRFIAGHSAGAAVMVRMTLDGLVAPHGLVSLNGALVPFGDAATFVVAPFAQWLSVLPFASTLMAFQANDAGSVERAIRATGSEIDAEGIELYRRLVSNPDHIAATLGMMADWDVERLHRDLKRLDVPMLLVTGEKDTITGPDETRRVATLLPGTRVEILAGLGHLAHEERGDEVAALIAEFIEEIEAASVPRTDTSFL